MNKDALKHPVSRKDRLVVNKAENELLIYDLDNHKAHCLNDTAARIWNACDGQRSASDISRDVSNEVGTPVDDDAVWSALANFQKAGLLQEPVVPPELLHQAGRRHAVRTLGLATLVAVPLITSMISPAAAIAISPT